MSNVDFEGVQETLKALEEKFGEKKMQSVTRNAINAGTEKVGKKLQSDMAVFKDKGYTVDEIVWKKATIKNFQAQAEIGWNGPHNRYRIIHLNEWGYTRKGRQITPRGFGVIAKSLKNSQSLYTSTIAEEVRRSL